jgi:hypothetical protein
MDLFILTTLLNSLSKSSSEGPKEEGPRKSKAEEIAENIFVLLVIACIFLGSLAVLGVVVVLLTGSN